MAYRKGELLTTIGDAQDRFTVNVEYIVHTHRNNTIDSIDIIKIKQGPALIYSIGCEPRTLSDEVIEKLEDDVKEYEMSLNAIVAVVDEEV